MHWMRQEADPAALRQAFRFTDRRSDRGTGSVEDLAAGYGVKLDEVRRFTERILLMEEDPIRERRVRELGVLVQAEAYLPAAEQLTEHVERQAAAVAEARGLQF